MITKIQVGSVPDKKISFKNQAENIEKPKKTKSEFVEYFLADTAAIVVGCSIVDAMFLLFKKNSSKTFCLQKLRSQADNMKKIRDFSNASYNYISATSAQLAEKFKKSYENVFKEPLLTKKEGVAFDAESLKNLSKNVKEIFIGMDSPDYYEVIAKPFLNSINKIGSKLNVEL